MGRKGGKEMKQRIQLIVTIEGNPDYFDDVKEMMRSYEVFGTGGGVKVVGVRRAKKNE